MEKFKIKCDIRGFAKFTPRELQVALSYANGMSVREVGEQLAISQKTVETYIQLASAKLGIHGAHVFRVCCALHYSELEQHPALGS